MRTIRLVAATALVLAASTAWAAEPLKKVLLVTHSGGFMHDSILVAEKVLKEIGPKNGFEVTCYRFTNDPDAKVKVKKKVDGKDVEMETTALAKYSDDFRARTGDKGQPGEEVTKENCGRINAETLKKFDCVLFFTTGNPVTKDELNDLTSWVKNGGAFCGTHCATDTLYDSPYGDLIGGYFRTHPAIQKIKLHLEDPKHPAAKGMTDGMDFEDEWYIMRDAPYSRDKLHIILSIDKDTFKPNQVRPDGDYAVSWCKEDEKGKVFYTSMGHRREVWRDPRYQDHLVSGIRWAMGLEKGDATPTAKLKPSDK
jgi:type 1 glutamine amidotransferase